MYDRFASARLCCKLIRDRERYPNPRNLQGLPQIKRIYRQNLREVQSEDNLRRGLMQGAIRIRYDEDGEGATEYKILKGEYSPHEISEIVDREWTRISSPYDCTGKMFTVSIHAALTPAGLVFVHRMGVDV